MYCVSVNLSSNEWIKTQQVAARQFPHPTLSRSEIIRRYVMLGIRTFSSQSQQEHARMTHELEASQPAPGERLRT